ncbi:hypothetical protein DFH07DRAFT_1030077 [Mycena maculata]|uniref:Uncharacterized protein n=1 Tax=Mycena maculata TaxID=230809 RepID=A0AAD7K6Q6_9AGAR|nr:hypothetical protein DFH07DRAFT_1030077 [Mycena maculata]
MKDGSMEPSACLFKITYVFPPYIPPHHFYPDVTTASGPGYGTLFGAPNPTPTALPTPPGAPIRWSQSPVSTPVKRGRGRPAGSGSKTAVKKCAANNSANVVAAKTKARPKAPAKKTKTTASQAQKENNPPTGADEPIDISDSKNEEDKSGYKHWADADKNKFYNFLLGLDLEGEHRFTQHQKNPNHVYKRASELLFDGKHSPKSIKGLWTRSVDGNGCEDPDSDDPTAILKSHLDGARKAGLVVGSLRPDIIKTWNDNGWWDLFNDRLGSSAKVSREIARNSASALSDVEEHERSDDYTSLLGSGLLIGFIKHPTCSASFFGLLPQDLQVLSLSLSRSLVTVNVLAALEHLESGFLQDSTYRIKFFFLSGRPRASFQPHTAPFVGDNCQIHLGNISKYVKIKLVSKEKKGKALEMKMELDQASLQLEQQWAKAEVIEGKVEMAEKVLEMNGTTDEVKAAANKFLLGLFK